MATNDRVYELLPIVYRDRDAAEGYPLRALLRIVGEQADLVERDIRALYEDLFIETCRTWVIPYIGDLVSNRLLFDASRLAPADSERLFGDLIGPDFRPPIAIRTRADVAKTIYYRRRKGTLPMLEELARDVTGWPAHAVEFFELLGWTQFREHFRPQSCWADVRNVDRMDRVDTAFDETSHTVDVRHIASLEGWHSINNVGFFLYRLQSFPLEFVPARNASLPWRYHFSPLGHKAPLFSRWRREGNEAGLATELHVAAPIRAPFFYEDLQRYRNIEPPPDRPDFTDLYGLPEPLPGSTTGVCPECSFFVVRNGTEAVTPTVDPAAPPAIFQPQVICRRLDPWPAAQPVGRLVAIDVESGRIAVGDGFPDATDRLDVYYHYGFSAEMGGGPYERRRWLVRQGDEDRIFVREGVPAGTPDTFGSVIDAVNEWIARGRRNTVITILDSRTYALPGQIQLRNEGFVVIEAANLQRPLLQSGGTGLEIDVLPPVVPGDRDRRAHLTLSGVVVEGNLRVIGDLGRLRLLHATLAPGRRLDEEGAPVDVGPSLEVAAGVAGAELNAQLRVEIVFSITGALAVPEHAEGIWAIDSIVDGLADDNPAIGGPAASTAPLLVLERSTVIGRMRIRSLEMSESIATGLIHTVRTQSGCVRFSYVHPGSRTPRRYRCQPDLAAAKAVEEALKRNPGLPEPVQDQIENSVRERMRPSFSSVRYGQPAYLQLRASCPFEIRTGAEDGSEMGCFSHLKHPQREGNLRLRLGEYLPFGLEAGIVYAT
jgi:hypothetical protein